MSKNSMKDIRSKNLKLWFSDKSIPDKEKSYISQLINGKAPFGEKSARRLEETYNMPSLYLDTNNSSSNTITAKSENFQIQVLDVTASAGSGYLNSDVNQVVKLIEYDAEQAKVLFNGLMSSSLKVININGDSMQGTFESGDAIYVDISRRSFEGDGIYVFTFLNSLYVKRLQVIKDKLIVISDNKSYRDWEIEENEINQLYIHGKVMLSQSMLLRKHG